MARSGKIGRFVFERGRNNAVRRALAALVVIIGLMLYVGAKVKIVRLGYQLDLLDRERRNLERENRSLQIEASSLTSPARIEEIAVKRLGMTRPSKENIVIVKRTSDQKH
jgi:cell division protein FtsL